MTELNETASQIMARETNRLKAGVEALVGKIAFGCPNPSDPSVYVEPEEMRDYTGISKEDAYRELAKLNFRSAIFPPSSLNERYLESTLPLYDALIPYLDDPEVRAAAISSKKLVEDKLSKSRLSRLL